MNLAKHSANSGQDLCRLTDWLERKGARFSSLCLCTYDDGERGAHAREPIRKGEVVLEVPLRLILTGQAAWLSAIGRQIEASSTKRRSSHLYLAAYVLQEKYAADSFWAPYIETLPRSFPQVPLFFGPEELALLEGSLILEKIGERRSALVEEYEDLCRSVPGFTRFTQDEFLWAHMVVSSRCFGMSIYGRETYGLVPMADMLNHKHPEETAWSYDDHADGFVLTALKNFAPGDPVHDSYGRKCNSELFLHHGFCLDENEDNQAEIRFGGSIDSSGDVSLPERAFRVPASLDHESTRRMMSFLRLSCARGDEELPPALGAETETGPVSVPNETRCLRVLAAACRTALRRFPTSLEEDEELLRGPGLSANARNAILMRRGEKLVLRYYLDHVEEYLTAMATSLG